MDEELNGALILMEPWGDESTGVSAKRVKKCDLKWIFNNRVQIT